MSEEHYLTFQKFSDKEAALELVELLNENSINFELEDASASFDPSFANSEMAKEYRVKLKKDDFEMVDKLLLQVSAKELDNIDKDHYLFRFTDEELMEIITKPDEWSQIDYLLSQKILKERGKEIKPEVVAIIKKQRLQELAKPEEPQRGWIIAGYVFSFLGGLLGVFIGWHLRYHKKTLPNGDSVYAYSANDRKQGYHIFVIGIVCFICWTILKLSY